MDIVLGQEDGRKNPESEEKSIGMDSDGTNCQEYGVHQSRPCSVFIVIFFMIFAVGHTAYDHLPANTGILVYDRTLDHRSLALQIGPWNGRLDRAGPEGGFDRR